VGQSEHVNNKETRVEMTSAYLRGLGASLQAKLLALATWLHDPRGPRWLRDERGAVYVEYTFLVGVVGVTSLGALVFAGLAVAKSYTFVRDYVLYPFP
jgi:Flp pilus assembly pilin Flp